MNFCESLLGESRCCLPEGHELPHMDKWEGVLGVTWTDVEATGWMVRGLPVGKSSAMRGLPARRPSAGGPVQHPAFELLTVCDELAVAAGELATKHLYLDPHDSAPDACLRAYCSQCMRYGVGAQEILHADSCVVGRTILALKAYGTQLKEIRSANPTERTSAVSSKAPAEQEGAAAEGLDRAQQLGITAEGLGTRAKGPGTGEQERSGALHIEYLAENPRDRFNPYQNPCPAARGGVICELENGHTGAHCSDGAVWADDGTVWADRSWRTA